MHKHRDAKVQHHPHSLILAQLIQPVMWGTHAKGQDALSLNNLEKRALLRMSVFHMQCVRLESAGNISVLM